MSSVSVTTTPGWPFLTSTVSRLPPAVEPSERVAVVTGANKGLGFGIVRGLCEHFDGYIYLTARDKKKGAEAVQVLKDMKVCKNPDKLRHYEVNVLNEDHVDNFFMDLRDTHGGIDILINNAGIAYKRKSTVPFSEQAEKTILTNYLGVVRMCVFLFPLLRPHARVVNLSSSAGHLSQISNFELKKRLLKPELTERELTDIMYEFLDITKSPYIKAHVDVGWPNSAYAVSKIGVNLLTRIYQKKFDAFQSSRDLVINAVHPGYFASNMSSFVGNVNIFQAAEAPLYCALLPPGISSPRGQFVWSDMSIMDMDSPTTPARPNDLEEYDPITDIREYFKAYETTSQYPQFGEVLKREREEYLREKMKETKEQSINKENKDNEQNVTVKAA